MLNVPAQSDRTAKSPISPLSWMWGGLLVGGGLGAVLHLTTLPPAAFGALVSVGAGLAMLPCALGWKRVDEAAREAHKAAWFWGGAWSLALVAGLFAWLARAGAGFAFDRFAIGRGDAGLIAAGIALCLLVQIVGYGLFWAGWWLSKR
jgi:hypothetical protein